MAAGLPDGMESLALVRRYEPVVRYTAGELFLPMPVEAYVAGAALWSVDPAAGTAAALVADHGELAIDGLCARAGASPDARLHLRYVRSGLDRRQLRQWRRDPDRPRFSSSTRFAAVGLFGRLIDAVFRLSLLLRGRVPGGVTAAVHRKYRATVADTHPYYAHVTTDGGYVVLQYWFLYAMNDWRSSFAGVNDHEADWEQVSIYLAPLGPAPPGADGAGRWEPVWVAFSSHDDSGADVRRRCDDPDLIWVDGTHPVVHAGAGSHSGGYVAGEYLVRVEPPALADVVRVVARIRETLFPWTRGRPRTGIGVPYLDYKRGDGVHVGPGTGRPWTPVLIDDSTAWVRDYRGLWGLDTADPFGGERAPAGPRYNRDGSIRECWADPVAWAGLDPVAPTPAARSQAWTQRLAELDERRDHLDAEIASQQQIVRRLAALRTVTTHDSANGARPDGQPVERLRDLRSDRRAVVVEIEDLRRRPGGVVRPPPADPRRRAASDLVAGDVPGLLLRFWTEASLSVLLAMLGVALLLDLASAPLVVLGAVLVVMVVEAVLRHRLLVFLLGVTVVAALTFAVWLVVTNWRFSLGALALLASLTLAVANLRSLLTRPRARRRTGPQHLDES